MQAEHHFPGGALPATADVVVIGAGSFGCAAAHQLAVAGLDTVLLDRFELASQTSPRAAGNTKLLRPQDVLTRLAIDSVRRIEGFSSETGVTLEFRQTGSLQIARDREQAERGRRELESAGRYGVSAREVGVEEVATIAPFVDAERVLLAWYSERDLYLYPPDLLAAFMTAARSAGAKTVARCEVIDVVVAGGRVSGVQTSLGPISTPVVIDTAGAWSAQIAERAGIAIPMIPMRHQVLVSHPSSEIAASHPICRILDAGVYLRPCDGGVMLGGFEADPQAHDMNAKPSDFQVGTLDGDRSVLDGLMRNVLATLPFLKTIQVKELRVGLPTITPDNLPVVGPIDGLDGFLIASGCCVGGLSISPSVGALLAEMVVTGSTTIPVEELSPQRFVGRSWTPDALADACRSTYSGFYAKTAGARRS